MIETKQNLIAKTTDALSKKYGVRGVRQEGKTTIKVINPYLDEFEQLSNNLFSLMDKLGMDVQPHEAEIDALFDYCTDLDVFDIAAISKKLNIYLNKTSVEPYISKMNKFFNSLSKLIGKRYEPSAIRQILLKDLDVTFPTSNQFHVWSKKKSRFF